MKKTSRMNVPATFEANKKSELAEFLTQQCEERGLSFRSLSMRAGLSPGTVHSIVRRKYMPKISSLNALADYLGVKREYLWQVAGLLEDMDYNTETIFSDPHVRFHFAQVDKLPRGRRNIILSVIAALIIGFEFEGVITAAETAQVAVRGDSGVCLKRL